MKNVLTNTKTVIILLAVTIISLGFYTYMLARPISYGMGYHNETVYEGEVFEGTLTFRPDGTMIVDNTSYEAMEARYYYKDGYVFQTIAQTDEEYEEEVAYINENFEQAIEAPFYSTTTNAFKQVAVGVDGYTMVYICSGAVAFAIAFGIFELLLIALTAVSLILRKKA